MIVTLLVGLFLNIPAIRKETEREEETYRHGRTGQHLALGASEELEAETFL